MSDDIIVMPITVIEEFHLARLVEDFIELVRESRGTGDPAIDRLTPNPYPEDSDAAAEFADAARDDLLDRRLADARRVRAALDEYPAGIDALTEEDALEVREILITLESLDSWLRTLTAIRLVIATRLGITSDDETGEDGRHDVYEWVGYRLELIIQAADEAESAPNV
ncbi:MULTISPECIES: DUF2017 family protein [Microbacterium]|uniref:DUF2017 family protein n=1 Tax=Microbacterium TaxID=33882 RepID=UPI000B82B00C|nr:DUF2017 family protein [Microbacterium oxydans]NJI59176.1 DUF2017 family protein [Microbacterium sp. B19(2022)]